MTLYADTSRVGPGPCLSDEVQAVRGRDAFAYDVAIVGLDVGSPTTRSYRADGDRVLAVDVRARLATVGAGQAELPLREPGGSTAAEAGSDLQLTNDVTRLRQAAAIVISVPTGVDAHLVPDLSLLAGTCRIVAEQAVPGQTILLTSTTYVGCTQDLLVTALRERGLRAGSEVFVAFSAERAEECGDTFDHGLVPRVVGGATSRCRAAAVDLLRRHVLEVHEVGSLGAAEMASLFESAFRAVSVALADEFADICEHLGIEMDDVIDAASANRFGVWTADGANGFRIPSGPRHLLWQLKRDRFDAPLIERAMSEIAQRPARIVGHAKEHLARNGRPIRRAKVLVVGVANTPDGGDLRESSALEILQRLEEAGARVGYVDHHVRSVHLPSGTELTTVDDPAAFHAELVVIHTRHRDLDLSWLTPAQAVLDVRHPARSISSVVA